MNEKILTTKPVMYKDLAISAKMRQVEPRVLGIKIVEYKIEEATKVWVPNYYLLYSYVIERNLLFNNPKIFGRSGKVAIVFDANEMHGSHYDFETDGEIPFVEVATDDIEGEMLADGGSMEEIIASTENTIQRQILWKAYKTEGNIKQETIQKFYRGAWQLRLSFKEKQFIKYAYIDDYGVSNERTRGLKVRLEI